MIDINVIHKIAQQADTEITEEIIFSARDARLSEMPAGLHPDVDKRVRDIYPNGLYSHQAKAIAVGINGGNVCVATPTASGKTLIFTSIAISHLLKSKGIVVLALYPAKALLHDQESKWAEAISGTGLKVHMIDGGVEVALRTSLLAEANVVLMTPDVLHSWMMAKLDQPEIRKFLGALSMVILDEAHIYDGIFGTNMSYLMRRLRAVSGVSQFLASSATIGDPTGFLRQLIGVDFELVGDEDDGAAVAEKKVMLTRVPVRKVSKFLNFLVKEYAAGNYGRFLVFADSRKRVEELAAESQRMLSKQTESIESGEASESNEDEVDVDEFVENFAERHVLPYRAGYEEDDRDRIQKALTKGTLLGVVTTSALELGIDIGDIELVVLLGEPPSVKSFWQRAGRAGRQSHGAVIMLDLDGRVSSMGLQRYLDRPPEINWLYLDNEYLQYANALCAAEEQQQTFVPLYSRSSFNSLPKTFVELLDNELEPRKPIPHDLYPLKQQAIGGPHRAFPIRNSIEKNYQVTCRNMPGKRLGTLSYSQVLREAFPGAIYRYMARPYRVFQLQHAKGEIVTSKTKGIVRTNPIVQTAVFPQFNDQLYFLRNSDQAFFSECRLQVSERVVGFVEQYGHNKKEVKYEQGNTYSQKPLNRYIDTTGICFHFPEEELQREKLGKYICIAFCRVCSVQDRDVGWGTFMSQMSPINNSPVKGFAIYDSAYGSLRLTKQIPSHLDEILLEASRIATEEGASQVAAGIDEIIRQTKSFGKPQENVIAHDVFETGPDDGWVTVIAPNQPAICHDGQSHNYEEVTVLRYLYTPQGIRYSLRAQKQGVEWQVSAAMIHPLQGLSIMEQYNINTGETKPIVH